MSDAPIIVSLPISDRARSHRFYADAFGFQAPGPPSEDGVPEPLTLAINDGLQVMLIPTGGFGWVTGDHETAAPGTSETLLTIVVPDAAAVRTAFGRAVDAGARSVTDPSERPWGYTALVADPDQHLWALHAADSVRRKPEVS
ncbi:MAG: VOC family protein [Actinomycetota bacterium]|nr:VOC family protein [Actinomycetota bacterium]